MGSVLRIMNKPHDLKLFYFLINCDYKYQSCQFLTNDSRRGGGETPNYILAASPVNVVIPDCLLTLCDGGTGPHTVSPVGARVLEGIQWGKA